MTNTVIVAKKSATAAGAEAGVSIAGLTRDSQATLKLRIHKFTGSGTASFVFEDTENAFTASVARAAKGYRAPTADPLPQQQQGTAQRDFAWKLGTDMPGLRMGVASAELRLNLVEITAGEITFEAWLESGG